VPVDGYFVWALVSNKIFRDALHHRSPYGWSFEMGRMCRWLFSRRYMYRLEVNRGPGASP